MKFKRSLTLGLTVAPLVMLVSCSTSWRKWEKTNIVPGDIEYTLNQEGVMFEQYRVRLNEIDNQYSVVKENGEQIYTIYLDKINNQFEFLEVISKILKMKSEFSAVDLWKSLTDYDLGNDQDMVKYFESILPQANINLVSGTKEFSILWDVKQEIENAQNGVANFKSKLGDSSFENIAGPNISNDSILASNVGKELIAQAIRNHFQSAGDLNAFSKSNIDNLIYDDGNGVLTFTIVGFGERINKSILGFKKNKTTTTQSALQYSKPMLNSVLTKNTNAHDTQTHSQAHLQLANMKGNTPLVTYLNFIKKLQTNNDWQNDFIDTTDNRLKTTIIQKYLKDFSSNQYTKFIFPLSEAKEFDIQLKGIDANYIPRDFVGVAKAGYSLLSVKAVKALIKYGSGDALLTIAKLLNYPQEVFKQLISIMHKIDRFWDQLMTNHAYKNWDNQAHRVDQGGDAKEWKINYSIAPNGKIVQSYNNDDAIQIMKYLFFDKNLLKP